MIIKEQLYFWQHFSGEQSPGASDICWNVKTAIPFQSLIIYYTWYARDYVSMEQNLIAKSSSNVCRNM